MSLAILVCDCAGSIPFARSFLKRALPPQVDPFSVPLLKGKEAKLFAQNHGLDDLALHLSRVSSFSVVVGWVPATPSQVYWADFNLPSPEQTIKAEAIVERFAQAS